MRTVNPTRVCQKAAAVFAIAELLVHPSTPPGPARRVTAELCWPERGAGLSVSYRVEGEMRGLRIPAASTPVRTDGLWQHTCFEMFLRPGPADGYLEFNFSPSGAWAAYRFAARRSGMQAFAGLSPPRIECRIDAYSLWLRASLDAAGLPGPDPAQPVEVGLSAVLEDDRDRRSLWALAHLAPVPDFHDPETFTLRARPPGPEQVSQ